MWSLNVFAALCVASTLGAFGMLRYPDTHEDAYLLCVWAVVCGLAFLVVGGPVVMVSF